jgi:transcriptional regulator CtsR
MSSLSNIIEEFIKTLFREAQDDILEIQRNELADQFRCAPSQINYVLATRFTLEHGYVVESRRGGGGYVRIIKLNMDEDDLLKLMIDEIGESISASIAKNYVKRLLDDKVIGLKEYYVLEAAISPRNIPLNEPYQGIVRASLLKGMLAALLKVIAK